MGARAKPLLAAFVAALLANLLGVLFFFEPIARGDTSTVSIHPALGLLLYVGLCIALLGWATQQLRSVFKAAFLVAAPQWVLIVDLTLRGERGVVTTAAGTVLLVGTWGLVALAYSAFDRGERKPTMSERPRNEYRPDRVSRPGETLAELRSERGLTHSELAAELGMSEQALDEIIEGKAPITPETATRLERVLGVPADFWSNLEREYRDDLAR